MLYRSLTFLEEQINAHFKILHSSNANILADSAQANNIAKLKDTEIEAANNVFITLVNLSEDSTLKNNPNYQRENMITVYKNPPVFLNLFILFSAVYTNYGVGLMHLSAVIRFFQAKNIFNKKNSSSKVIDDVDDFDIAMDLFSPTFEQANYLWSTLGGKQHPFALYKLRIITMERESTTETRGIIKEITLNEDQI